MNIGLMIHPKKGVIFLPDIVDKFIKFINKKGL